MDNPGRVNYNFNESYGKELERVRQVEQQRNAPVSQTNSIQPQQTEQTAPANSIQGISPLPGRESYKPQGNDRGNYWMYPENVVRQYNQVQAYGENAARQNGIDPELVSAIYNIYDKANKGKTTYEWTGLPDDDFNKGYIRQLENPAGWTQPQQQGTGDWNSLPLWQQIALGLSSPQPISNRPDWTRAPAVGIQSLLAAWGGYTMGTAAAGAAGLALAPVTGGASTALSAAAPVVGIGTALAAGGATAYQAWTNEKVPVASDVLAFSNIPSQWFEQIAGVAEQLSSDPNIAELFKNKSAWNAAGLTWDKTELAQGFYNQMSAGSKALGDALGENGKSINWGGGEQAGSGQTWAFEQGIADPQALAVQRDEIFKQYRDEYNQRIAAGENEDKVAEELSAKYQQMLGISGQTSDLVLGTLLDPMNVVAFGEGKVGAKLADLAGKPELAAAFRANTGNLAVDMLPIGAQQLAEGIANSAGRPDLRSSNPMAALGDYRNIIRSGQKPIATLDGFDRMIAGLDPQNRIVELSPTDPGRKYNTVRSLAELTPETKATIVSDMADTNWQGLIDRVDADPDKVVSMSRQIASGNAVTEAGEFGQRLANSPEAKTWQEGFNDFVGSGKVDDLEKKWHMVDGQRSDLIGLASELGIEPAKLLDALSVTDGSGMTPDQLLKLMNENATSPTVKKYMDTGDPMATMKQSFNVFTEGEFNWHPDAFKAEFKNTMRNHMDEYLIKQYGITTDPAVFRLGQLAKTIQSILLLNFSPKFLINNATGNIVGRSSVGVYGHMSERQITGLFERMGYTPETVAHLTESLTGNESGAAAIKKAKRANDMIQKAQDFFSGTSQKLSLFSSLSGKLENLESSQSQAIGTLQYLKKAWEPGKGMSRMSPELEAMLDRTSPGLKEAIYSATKAGLNMTEITNAIYGDTVKRSVRSYIDDVSRNFSDTPPEIIHDLFEKSGISQELEDGLRTAKTPQEARAAFDRIERNLDKHTDILKSEELINRAGEVAEQVKAGGLPKALELISEMNERYAHEWMQYFIDWGKTMADADMLDGDARADLIQSHQADETRHFKTLNDFVVTTQAGIMTALGTDNDVSRAMVDTMRKQQEGWTRFYQGYDENGVHIKGKNDLLREYFDLRKSEMKKAKSIKDKVQRDAAYEVAKTKLELKWDTIQAEIRILAGKADQNERTTQMEMNGGLAQALNRATGRDDDAAARWLQMGVDKRQEMTQARNAFLEAVGKEKDIEKRRKMWDEFVDKTYNPYIADLANLRIKGAYDVAGEKPPKTVEPLARPAEVAEMTAYQQSNRNVIYGLANKHGIPTATAEGAPNDRFLLAVINKYMGTSYTNVGEADPKIVSQGLKKYTEAHAADVNTHAANVMEMAKSVETQAKEHVQAGLTRKALEEQIKTAFPNVSGAEVDLTMALIDAYADRWARENGLPVGESSRDRWVNERIGGVVGEGETQQPDAILEQRKSQPGQMNIFSGGEDLPLFSGTPQKAQGEVFDPQEASAQESLFNMQDMIEKKQSPALPETPIQGKNGQGTLFQAAKGAVSFTDGKAIIRAFGAADVSTLVHEIGHVFRRGLSAEDMDTIAKWGGLNDGAELANLETLFQNNELKQGDVNHGRYVEAEEKFARGWEKYLQEGDAPTPGLRQVFQKFTQWITDIYRQITGSAIDVDIHTQINGRSIKDIFDRMLATEEELSNYKNKRSVYQTEAKRKAEQARVNAELYKPLEAMTPEDAISAMLNTRSLADRKAAAREFAARRPDLMDDLFRAFPEIAQGMDDTARAAKIDQIEKTRIQDMDEGMRDEIKHALYELKTQLDVAQPGGRAVNEQGEWTGWKSTYPDWYGSLPTSKKYSGQTGINAVMAVVDDLINEREPAKQVALMMAVKRMAMQMASEEPNMLRATGDYPYFGVEKSLRTIQSEIESMARINDSVQRYDSLNGLLDELLMANQKMDDDAPFALRERSIELEMAIDQAMKASQEEMDNGLKLPDDVERVSLNGETPEIGRPVNNLDNPVLYQMDQLPETMPEARALSELSREKMKPILAGLRDAYINDMNNKPMRMGDVSPEAARGVKDWLDNKVADDLATTKYAAIKHGEMLRSDALLSYNRRYGFDNIANMVFPYQFWYTRTMANWLKRFYNKPQWVSMYARIEQNRKKNERENIPARLRGKIRIPAPFLPEYMGNSLYIDPGQTIFPFAAPIDSAQTMQDKQEQLAKNAEWNLKTSLDNGEITQMQYDEAMTHKGATWTTALSKAQDEDGSDNPLSMVSLFSSPGMHITAPLALMEGKPEKIGMTPAARYGRAIKTELSGTPLQGVGDLFGLLAQPEQKMHAGATEFGQFGTYYVERELANMTREGKIDAQTATKAMIDQSGQAYDEAYKRVLQTQAIKEPGMLTVEAMKKALAGGGSAGDVIGALLAEPWPKDVYPQGEYDQKVLKKEYSAAWEAQNAGDIGAVTRFMEKYPEIKAKLATGKDPEARLRSYLVDDVWAQYNALPELYRKQAGQVLGDKFQQAFLNKETRAYGAIDNETLAQWANAMSKVSEKPANLPVTVTAPVDGANPAEMPANWASKDQAEVFQQFQNEVEQFFKTQPEAQKYGTFKEFKKWYDSQDYKTREDTSLTKNYSGMYAALLTARPDLIPILMSKNDPLYGLPQGIQQEVYQFRALRSIYHQEGMDASSAYFDIPETNKAARKSYLRQHPEVQGYWDFKKQYAKDHPKSSDYLSAAGVYGDIDPKILEKAGITQSGFSGANFAMRDLDPMLLNQIVQYKYANIPLGAGAKKALKQAWENAGKPGGDVDTFLEGYILPNIK